MGDFPSKSFDKWVTDLPQFFCDDCDGVDECDEECRCDDCNTNRAEANADAMNDTYD